MKKVLAILLAVVMLAAIAACGSDDATPAAPGAPTGAPATPTPPPGVLGPGDTIAAPEGPDVQFADSIDVLVDMNIVVVDPLNPGAGTVASRLVQMVIFDRLVIRTADGEYIPELATSWETTDWQTITFNLRDDVVFHNGDRFTAQHVVDTANAAKSAPGSLAFDSWRSVDTITAVNDTTVRMVLGAVNVDFLWFLALPGASIINRAAAAADAVNGVMVGTGAFYVSNFVSGDFTQVTRNDDYWGEAPLTRELTFRFIPEIAARTVMIMNNESQVCTSISPEDLHLFVNDSDYVVYRIVSNSAHALGFNMLDPITGDINFRKAVAHALERADVAVVAAGDWAIADNGGTFWGDTTEFRNNDIPLLPFDLDLARQYLAASTYNGEEIEIYTGVPTFHRSAEMIQEQLLRIGINLVLHQTDAPTLQSLAVYGSDTVQIVHHPLPFNMSAASARTMLGPGGSANRSTYDNPAVTQLLDLAPTIADRDARGQIYRQIQALVAEDLTYVNVFFRVHAIVTHGNIGGIVVNPDQNHDYRGIFMTLED